MNLPDHAIKSLIQALHIDSQDPTLHWEKARKEGMNVDTMIEKLVNEHQRTGGEAPSHEIRTVLNHPKIRDAIAAMLGYGG